MMMMMMPEQYEKNQLYRNDRAYIKSESPLCNTELNQIDNNNLKNEHNTV